MNSEKLFFEESTFLAEGCRELFIHFDTLRSFNVYESLTFFDLVKIHRLFHVTVVIFCAHLKKFFESEPEIVARSLLPVYQKDIFSEILEIVIDKEKVQSFFNLFSWNPKGGGVLDLQYQPILFADDYFILPMHLFLFSDYLRNTLFLVKRRFFEDNKEDPMLSSLAALLKQHFPEVENEIDYNFRELKGDIDIIAKKNSTVFIFEGKRSLLSGSIHEIRTIHDHVNKAANQLSKISESFRNNQFKKYLSDRLNWDLDSVDTISTCIVIGNRMFSGYRVLDHPVRSFYELANFIYSGEVQCRDGVFCQWLGEEFSEKDLFQYLENDSYHKLVFECMFNRNADYDIRGKVLRHKSFYANFELLFDKFRVNYRDSVSQAVDERPN